MIVGVVMLGECWKEVVANFVLRLWGQAAWNAIVLMEDMCVLNVLIVRWLGEFASSMTLSS